MDLLETLQRERIVAIFRGVSPDEGLQTAEAFVDAGIGLMEVTLNTPGALEMIASWRKRFETRARIGAGTVLDVEMAQAAIDAGAAFLISPNLDEAVIDCALSQGVDVWPGVMTPTEMVRAWKAGARAVKLFPMGALGLNYLKEVRAPLNHIPIMATGGVTLDNIDQYFAAGAVAVGLGGNLVDQQLLRAKDYDGLRDKAAAFVAKARL